MPGVVALGVGELNADHARDRVIALGEAEPGHDIDYTAITRQHGGSIVKALEGRPPVRYPEPQGHELVGGEGRNASAFFITFFPPRPR